MSISICDVKHVLPIVEFWRISNIYTCELCVANAKTIGKEYISYKKEERIGLNIVEKQSK